MSEPISHHVDVTVSLASANIDAYSFGSVCGIFDHSVTANRQDGPYTSLAEVVAAGFTAAAEAEVNAWATAVFAQDDKIDEVYIGREDVGDADWTATVTAVLAEDPLSFYILTAETRAEADILLVAAAIEAADPPKIYIAQSSDAAILAGTPGNVALDLQAASYNRTALFYHATDSGLSPNGYLDGAIASSGGGLNVDGPNGQGTWKYRQLEGVASSDITSAEATEVYDADCNLFSRGFTSDGVMSSGRFIDVTVSLDWLKVRLEEAILAAFLRTSTKIPFTNAGIATIVGAIEGVFSDGITYGHLSPDEPPTLVVPKVQDISAAAKEARTLTLTGNAVLAGAIHKASLTINVQQ
jgi:hypothetical protein